MNIPELQEEYDLVINLTHNLVGGLLNSRVKSIEKSGRIDDGNGMSIVSGKWAKYLFAMAPDRKQNLFNIVDIYLGMGEVAQRPVSDYLTVPHQAAEEAGELLRSNGWHQEDRLIALQMGASNPNRVWPLAHFAAVANSLGRRPGVRLTVLGSASESAIAQDFLRQVEVPIINLVGKTDLLQLTGVIKRCALMISNDTGPLHLAAALGIKVLGLYFCSGHFAETAPYGPGQVVLQAELPCSPCHEGQACETLACRDILTAEAVLNAAETMLFGKTMPPILDPDLAVYQSRFLTNGTLLYSPLSGNLSAQYQTGFINRRMIEAAFGVGHDAQFDQMFLPGLRNADGFQEKIRQHRNALIQLQQGYREALKTAHTIVRELTTESVHQGNVAPLIHHMQQLEKNLVASPSFIIKNIHRLEMMHVGSKTPRELFAQMIPRYSRLHGYVLSSLSALEGLALSPEGTVPPRCRDEVLYLALSSGENFGWGICGDYLTRELSRRVKTVSLFNNEELAKNRNLPGSVFHTLTAAELSTLFPARGTRNFGYTFFENELPPRAFRNAREYDQVFAGSTWCQEKLVQGGIANAGVLIQGVDREIFHPITAEKDQERFVIFSGGKFELRKGQDLVLQAVKILQRKYADLFLINIWYNKWPQSMQLMSLSPHIRYEIRGQSWVEIMDYLYRINGIDGERVTTYPIVSNLQLRSLYQQTDLGVFPNRCEGGTNLVLMEYMACAKPVVASYTSGHKDILTRQNSLMLTNMKRFLLHDDGKRLVASWEEPSLEELVATIEYAYHHREQIRAIGKRAGEDMQHFTWDKAAAKIVTAIFDRG